MRVRSSRSKMSFLMPSSLIRLRSIISRRSSGSSHLQDLEVPLDGVERRLELVGQDRDEVEADLALLLGQPARLLAEDELLGRLAHGVAQFLGGERLGKEVVGAQLGGLDRRLEGRVGGDHDGEDGAALSAQLGRGRPGRSCPGSLRSSSSRSNSAAPVHRLEELLPAA